MAGKWKNLSSRLTEKKIRLWDVILTLILVLGAVFVFRNAYQYDWNFSTSVEVESPWLVKLDRQGREYIVDQEKARILVVEDGVLIRSISGGAPKGDTFYSAENIDIADNGDIYVLETGWSMTGFSLDYESILRYSPEGESLGICYEVDYSDLYTDKHRIFGLDAQEGGLYFVTADDEGFRLQRMDMESQETEELYAWKLENAYTLIQDFVIDPGDHSVYAIDKRGKLFHGEMGEESPVLLYEMGNSESGEKTVFYRGAIGEDGTVYITDIASNRLLSLSPGNDYEPETILEGSQMWNVWYNQLADGRQVLSYVDDGGIGTASPGGTDRVSSFSYSKSSGYVLREVVFYGAATAALIAFLLLLIRLLAVVLTVPYSNNQKIGALVISTVIIVAIIIVYGLMGQFRSLYRNELLTKLSLTAQIVSNLVNEEKLDELEQPQNYMNDSYQSIWSTMDQVLDKDYDYSEDIYCNILRYDGISGYAVAYLDNSIGCYYPLTEEETWQVEEVYETGATVISDVQSETGSYIYVMVPLFGESGQVVGVVSVGTLSSVIDGKISDMTGNIVIAMIMIVLAIMFLYGEVLSFFDLRDKFRLKKRAGESALPMHVVRLAVFITFMAFNMATSFLPVYILRFVRTNLGIPEALANSLPMTLNLIAIGLTSMICPGLMKRLGFRKLAAASGLTALCGDLMMALCFRYEMVLAGLILNGIGVGLITNSIHIFLASVADEEENGFSIYNAASLSGINCGMLLGSALAERMGQANVYFVSAGVWLLVMLVFLVIGGQLALKDRKTEEAKRGSMLKFMASPGLLKFLICIQIPYIVINSFTYYYVPIFGSEHGLSENITSLLIITCSLCSVYLSVAVTNYVSRRFGNRAMYLSTIITFAGLLFFAWNMSLPALIVALLLIGLANSFGSTTRIARFIRMDEAVRYGEDNAMSTYDLFDNLGESAGSIIFASIISVGFSAGILVLAGCVGGLNALYALTERGGRSERKKR